MTPSDLPGSNPDFLVARAYYQDREMVNQVSNWLEPWEHNIIEKYLVVGVYREEYQQLTEAGFRLEIDPQLTMKINQAVPNLPQQTTGIPGYPCYRTLAETYATAEMLAQTYPRLASWIDIGDSWQKAHYDGGSDLRVLRLTNSARTGTKPKLFIMASVHAREYAPAELATRFAEKLLREYGSDPDISWLLDDHEVHLLLQANPDGRSLAETRTNSSYIWWRKNTNQDTCTLDPLSRGVDLNRNFDFLWGCCGGSSDNGCNLIYRGFEAGSEPETQAVQNYLRSQFPDQRGPNLSDPVDSDASGIFLDIHSYGRLILWPWGFTTDPAPNSTQLRTFAKRMAYFNRYEPLQSYELYLTDGTTIDFAFGELGLASYTYEVGLDFFENCDYFENTLVPDNLAALLYALKTARHPYQLPSGPDVLSIRFSPSVTLKGEPVRLNASIDDSRYYNGFNHPEIIEPTQNIEAAEYTIDIPPWDSSIGSISNALQAADGFFDEPVEAVSAVIDTSELEAGLHTLYVRGMDEAGNWGPVSAGFLFIANEMIFLPSIFR